MKKTLNVLAFLILLGSCAKSEPPATPPPPALKPPVGFTQEETKDGLVLSAQARLRKLSLHLRGITPDLQEYDDLKTAKDLTLFFKAKTDEYLKSPRYVAKMVDRLDTLFRLRQSAGLPESRALKMNQKEPDPTLNPGQETYNSMDLLFERIAKENLSWDSLLTEKNYEVQSPEPTVSFRTSDLAFFRPIAPELPEPQPTTAPIVIFPITSAHQKYDLLKTPFKENDARLAGSISTSRFLARYSTTNLNKSRGRAAAIFRIFLCDDMRAVVEPKPEEEAELLENAFPKPRWDSVWLHSSLDEDKHGTQPACMACHYKLDPMGKAFINYSTSIALEPANGALVYNRADGTQVNLPGKGLGQVLHFLAKQPEYATCQVSHFWKWFIRGDQLPKEERLKELVQKFNELGHRTNDFVAYLVSQPEFSAHPDSITVSTNLADVKPVLLRCDECHSGVTEQVIPSFVKFPLGGNEKEHREWLATIARKLDIKNNGLNKKMPPKDSAWQPTEREIALVKEWVRQGAKAEDDKTTIDESLAKSLVE